jgi:hypothetical protein
VPGLASGLGRLLAPTGRPTQPQLLRQGRHEPESKRTAEVVGHSDGGPQLLRRSERIVQRPTATNSLHAIRQGSTGDQNWLAEQRRRRAPSFVCGGKTSPHGEHQIRHNGHEETSRRRLEHQGDRGAYVLIASWQSPIR